MDFYASLTPYYPEKEIQELRLAQQGKAIHSLYLNNKVNKETLLSLYPHLKPHPFIENAFYYDEEEYPLGKSMLFNLGAFYIMDAASMLPPYFLSPQKGERILDMCAAPGGKTSVLSLLLGNQGTILSNDISYPRSKENSGNVERLGLGNVVVTSGDFVGIEDNYEDYFDAILLDAPCSGSAMFRKDRRLSDDWTYEKVLKTQSIQKSLLESAAKMLVSGGRIMYSTCSFSYEEDEEIILSFLKRHEDFEAVFLPDDPSFYHHPDLPQGIHLFPHRYAGEGQFLCLLRHKGDKVAHKQEKIHQLPKSLQKLSFEYGLEGYDYLSHQDSAYVLPEAMKTPKLSLLRYGVRIGEEKTPFQPDHALASFAKASIPIEKENALRYLAGETFPLQGEDGYAVVSYLGIPLGYVKLVKGTAKNHYPKGLRRRY